jgi:hypothetical protein
MRDVHFVVVVTTPTGPQVYEFPDGKRAADFTDEMKGQGLPAALAGPLYRKKEMTVREVLLKLAGQYEGTANAAHWSSENATNDKDRARALGREAAFYQVSGELEALASEWPDGRFFKRDLTDENS